MIILEVDVSFLVFIGSDKVGVKILFVTFSLVFFFGRVFECRIF